MNEDGDYMDGYNDGFIDGRGTMLKPLRWRTGPVPKKDRDGLYLVRTITPDYYLLGGHTINGSTRCDAWLPSRTSWRWWRSEDG